MVKSAMQKWQEQQEYARTHQPIIIRKLAHGNYRIEGKERGFFNSDFQTRKEAKQFLTSNKTYVKKYLY